MNDPKYIIVRAPLVASFEVPSQKELLALKSGDLAKIMFKVKDDNVERMWVKLTDCSNPEQWSGKLESNATQPKTLEVLSPVTIVAFHPRDIVAVE